MWGLFSSKWIIFFDQKIKPSTSWIVSWLLHFSIGICTANNRHMLTIRRIILRANIVKWLHFPYRNLFLLFETKLHVFFFNFAKQFLIKNCFTNYYQIYFLYNIYVHISILTQITCHLIFCTIIWPMKTHFSKNVT